MANILVVGKYYPPFEGGTEVYTRDICEMLAIEHDVTAVVFNHEPGHREEFINGVKVVRCATQLTWKSQPIALSMMRAIDFSNADLVHFHAPNFFGNAVMLLKRFFSRKRPVLLVTHHMDVQGRAWIRNAVMPLYHYILRSAAVVIVTSTKYAAISRDLLQRAPIVSIPLGIDVEQFSLNEEQRAAAAKWRTSLVNDARTVGFIGRHARYKGLNVLIKALARLENVHGLIAGDGPYRQGAANLAAELGIADRVHFLGRVSEHQKLQLFAASDVFAFPSTEVTEAFGVSQLEAMAMGTPVVSSDLPTGVTDVALYEMTALLARPGDVDSLETCLRRVLDDKVLAERLVARAREHLIRNFTRKHMLERTHRLIAAHLRSAVSGEPVNHVAVAASVAPQSIL